eukprot:g7686.t1
MTDESLFRSDLGNWRNDKIQTPSQSFVSCFGSTFPHLISNATQPSSQFEQQNKRANGVREMHGFDEEATQIPMEFDATTGCLNTTITANLEQPVLNMEAFLQEIEEPSILDMNPVSSEKTYTPPLPSTENSVHEYHEHFTNSPIMDPMKFMDQFSTLSFDAMHQLVALHLWTVGPISDMMLFHLFRKVFNKEQADRAVGALMKDRECRIYRGEITPYSEVTSSSVFNALNRTGGDEFVLAAVGKSIELGLSLSRSNMYHLMKQYSIQGKVESVETLFRALESLGKSWNSNCIVIMMLAYFNRGKFEEADQLRHELKSKGIKISQRIEHRLDLLLSGEEQWRWKDQVYYRTKHTSAPPPGFGPLRESIGVLRGYPPLSRGTFNVASNPPRRTMHTQSGDLIVESLAQDYKVQQLPLPTLFDAVLEPRIHLNILRAASFDDLFQVLTEFIKSKGPVENVCISFLFRKVKDREEAEKAMELLNDEREARKRAGISEDFNETTCTRIFSALVRTGESDMAFSYAKKAADNGLVLSGKAYHELLKSFAARNEVENVEKIWTLAKTSGKTSSRIVYSMFRIYFDNGMMERAGKFRDEIEQIGIKLSGSALRNIEDVLSGIKQWVKDPHAGEF